MAPLRIGIKGYKPHGALLEIEILTIAVEQGYSVSSTIGDWEDGENVEGEI